MAFRRWLLPPHLSDKLIDWELLVAAGGQEILLQKDVVEFGPSYSVDLFMWAPCTASYTMFDLDEEVIAHVERVLDPLNHAGFAARLIKHDLRTPLPLADASADVVIDFGTIDNVLGGDLPYREAMRILRPGGYLLTSYANRRYFGKEMSDAGDEVRLDPHQLCELLRSLGSNVFVRRYEDQPRAIMGAKKF